MNTVSEFDKGWVVGILEGEGYFGAKILRGRWFNGQVCVASTDEEVVIRLLEVLGVGVCNGPYQRDSKQGNVCKPIFKWNVAARQEVMDVCNYVYDHMTMRRQEAIDAIRAIDAYTPKAGVR